MVNEVVNSETALALLGESSLLAVVADAQGNVQFCTYGFFEALGVHSELIIGEPVARWLFDAETDAPIEWTKVREMDKSALAKARLVLKSERARLPVSLGLTAKGEGDAAIYALTFSDSQLAEHYRSQLEAREATFKAQREALYEISNSEILNSGDLEVIISVLIEVLSVTMEIDRVSVWFWDDGGERLRRSNLYEKSADKHHEAIIFEKKDYPCFFSELESNRSLFSNNCMTDDRFAELRDNYFAPNNIGALMIHPVKFEGAVIGYILNAHVGPERIWTEEERFFSNSIADFVTLAIETREHNDALERLEKKEAELKKANEELESSLNSKSESLQNLQSGQNELIHTEKMATLGTLIAGVAHEINTPLGAISASGNNLGKSLPVVLSKLPEFSAQLTPELRELFEKMVERCQSYTGSLSSRDERKHRKAIKEQLEANAVQGASGLAKYLVKIGILDEIEMFMPVFKLENYDEFMDMAYAIGRLRVNIDNIATAVAKTQKIVYALKSYSRKNSFEEPEMASMIKNVETVLTIYHNQLKYGVEVTQNFEQVPDTLCYPDQLNQVWTNIIHNAIQAMNGKGELLIDILYKEEEQLITVKITDNGPGIPQDIVNRIFDPFFTTKVEGEGSGLGLDICRKIVRNHGGDINVDSEPGRTRFVVTIPVRSFDDEYFKNKEEENA